MGNLRTQLLLSHLVLALLMVLVMVGAVVSFFRLGHSIDRILWDNQRSVIAAQDMKETLERQDSAATFFLAGQIEKARKQYQANWPKFHAAWDFEEHNITEVGEQEMADDIGRQFKDYRAAIERLLYANPPMQSESARKYYFATLEPSFLRLKQRAQDVLDLNQAAIQRADRRAIAEARRASWIGIGMTVGAFVLAILFAVRAIGFALSPLTSVARQAEQIGAGHLNQTIELRRNDEIGALASAFNQMTEKLRVAKRIEEERLHRAERMSDAALENLYDPVIVTDSKGTIVHLNHAAEGLFGPAAGASGKPVAEIVKDRRIAAAVDRAIQHEHVVAAEGEAGFVPLQAENAHRTYRLRATPMRDEEGVLLGAVAVLEDVTHLRQLDQLKTEFIGVASHELRTPITSLLMSVQSLEEGAVGPLTPDQKTLVGGQMEDIRRLERLTRDLLDLTKLEAGATPPRFEVVAPGELIEFAVDSARGQMGTKDLHIQIDAPSHLPGVRADRTQITRVLSNLLTNAIRHTPEGGRISVSARAQDHKVAISVNDTGTGIPADYVPRIFDRFVQVPGATRGGAGLGLSISQTIIKAHGGEISAESELGKGSAFTFTLPTADEPVKMEK